MKTITVNLAGGGTQEVPACDINQLIHPSDAYGNVHVVLHDGTHIQAERTYETLRRTWRKALEDPSLESRVAALEAWHSGWCLQQKTETRDLETRVSTLESWHQDMKNLMAQQQTLEDETRCACCGATRRETGFGE